MTGSSPSNALLNRMWLELCEQRGTSEAFKRIVGAEIERRQPLPTAPPVITPVFMICVAYESGFGHGKDQDNLPNPYSEGTEEHEAYKVGYDEGYDRRWRNQQPNASELPSSTLRAAMGDASTKAPPPSINMNDRTMAESHGDPRITGGTTDDLVRCAFCDRPVKNGAGIVHVRRCCKDGEAFDVRNGLTVREQGTPRHHDSASLEQYNRAMQAAGVPHELLQVYDSNSWRRVGLARTYHTVMAPTVAPDGHPDIHGTEVLHALVAAFNCMLEGRGS
jgi:hypothetical protein